MGDDNGELANTIQRLEQHLGDSTPRTQPEERFDLELIDIAETILERVFHISEQGSRSSSEVFAGRVKGSLALKKTSNKWTHRIHATETSAAKFSRTQISAEDFRKARAVRVINELPREALVYIRHEYMPNNAERYQYTAAFFGIFWAEYLRAKGDRRLDLSTLSRMAQTIVASTKRELALYKSDYLVELFGMPKSTWANNYLPEWRAMLTLARRLHNRSLSIFIARY